MTNPIHTMRAIASTNRPDVRHSYFEPNGLLGGKVLIIAENS